jgi:hypothetical protein
MFGSDHNGERTASAAKADELVRSVGLTWPEILLPPRELDTIEALIDLAGPRRRGVERARLPSRHQWSSHRAAVRQARRIVAKVKAGRRAA